MMRWLILPAFLAFFSTSASATNLQPPTGKVILTVSGAVAEAAAKESIRFDLAGLEALGVEHIETSNPWMPGATQFSGVPLTTLLKAVGAFGGTVRVTALNDYRADIPLSDLDQHRILIASRLNGELMAIRDKGPLWIIYPVEGDPSEVPLEIRNRMVWQLNALEILE